VALAIPGSVVLWQLDSIVASGGSGSPATLEVKAAILAYFTVEYAVVTPWMWLAMPCACAGAALLFASARRGRVRLVSPGMLVSGLRAHARTSESAPKN
jgi:hypothetical protein